MNPDPHSRGLEVHRRPARENRDGRPHRRRVPPHYFLPRWEVASRAITPRRGSPSTLTPTIADATG